MCCRSVGPRESATEFVSDYFDFSIYIDADEAHIEEWYVQRFMKLRDTVFQNPDSFFRHFAAICRTTRPSIPPSSSGVTSTARTSARTSPHQVASALLLRKGADHRVTEVSLRRL